MPCDAVLRLVKAKTYGSGGAPKLPMPPVPQTFDSQAVTRPSLSAPILTSANADGRLPRDHQLQIAVEQQS